MLNQVEITQFKSCLGTILDELRPVTILVGRNGAGKTNILSSIEWLAKVASQPGTVKLPGLYESYSVAAKLEVNGRKYKFSASADWTPPRNSGAGYKAVLTERLEEFLDGNSEIIFSRQDQEVKIADRQPITIKSGGPGIPSILALIPKDDPLVRKIEPVFSFFANVRYYPLDEPTAPARQPGVELISESEYQKWRATRDTSSGTTADEVPIKLVHLHAEKNFEKLEEIKSILGRNGIGLIDDINIDVIQGKVGSEPSIFYYVQFTPCSGRPVDLIAYKDLSHGTRRVLRMVLSLLCDGASLMLVEHPEDGIHSGLLKKIIPLLRAYTDPVQEIIASHSASLLDTAEPEDVKLVTMDFGVTSVRSLSADELDAAASFIDDDGPLSGFLNSIES